MKQPFPTDSTHSSTTEIFVMVKPDTATLESKQAVRTAKSDDLLHPAYIFQYDSAKCALSLDSTSVKAFGTGLAMSDFSKGSGFLGDPILPMLRQQDGIFLALLVCFLLISKILQRGYRFLFEGVRFMATFRERRDTFNEITIKEFWGNLFLTLQPAFLIALVAYQFFQQRYGMVEAPWHGLVTITSFTLLIAIFLIFKYFYYLLIGYTFDIKDFVLRFLRVNLVLLELLGILIFVPTLAYLYGTSYQQIFLIAIVALFSITQIILFSRLIVFFFNKRVNFLFGIAYLCAVEIAPYVFLAFGFSFLYKEDFFCILCH
jgi:hypothetical protein